MRTAILMQAMNSVNLSKPDIVQEATRHVKVGKEEIMYFNSDYRGAGFTIFPYDHGRWRYQIGLR